MEPVRVVSYGGGVQSTALLVLAAQGKIDYGTFLFANTGDDSENPATLRFVREVATPWAAEHGVEVVELQRVMRDGSTRTLLEEIKTQDRSIPIPARMGEGRGGFGRKRCTDRFKIAVVRRETIRRGASVKHPATVAIGISTDEIERAKVSGLDPRDPTRTVAYPLLDLGVSRQDCRRLIADAGLPVPPKSACVFCPLHDMETWRRMRTERPDEWATAVDVDGLIRERALRLGRGDVGLVHAHAALSEAVDDQLALFTDGECDSGYCFT